MDKTPNNNLEHKELSENSLDHASLRARVSELELRYQSLKGHAKALINLNDSAAELMSRGSLDELLEFIAKDIVDKTVATGVYLHMLHETEDYLTIVAASGPLSDLLLGKVRYKEKGLSSKAWLSGNPEFTASYNTFSDRATQFEEDVKAVSIPLRFLGKISGFAFITSSVNDDLENEIPLLQEFVKVASQAIYHTQQQEVHANELRRIKALSELGSTLYESADRDIMFDSLCKYLFEIMECDRVSIYLEAKEKGTIYSQVSHNRLKGEMEITGPKPVTTGSYGINGWVFENSKIATIDRHFEDPRETPEVHEFRLQNNVGSTMSAPITDNGKTVGVIAIIKHINKRNYNSSDADALQSVASQVAIALQRNDAVSLVKHQAFHDGLTDLPNKRHFEEYFQESVTKSKEPAFAILFCDLDGFKDVNDSHGHDIGDKVVNICAARLTSSTRASDYLARMGGGQFAILVDLNNDELDIKAIAKRAIDSISKPINVDNILVNLSMSIGISLYPEDGRSFSELLNYADVAMYQAKQSSKEKILNFNKADFEKIRNKNELRADLHNALSKDELELWYQPQVNWKTGKVTGVEALLRWNHSQKGMISPFLFIPIAEESGLIEPIGLWVMEEAISQLKKLDKPKHENFSMAVNIAPPQFSAPDFSDRIIELINNYDVDPTHLKAEITESFIMNEREVVVEHLKNLRSHGVMVAIDDFGTGYSSLSYLQDLPIDVLKIDRSFVNVLNDDNYQQSIAASIIALANSLKLSTITEGVETSEQLGYIKNLGSEIIQGYLYSKPVPANELPDVIMQIEKQNIDHVKAA